MLMRAALSVAASILMAATSLHGQVSPGLAGFYGTALTPIGGLAPTAPSALESEHPSFGIAVRYGHFGWEGHVNSNNYGATINVPVRGNVISASLGRAVPDCEPGLECHGFTMMGLAWERALLSLRLSGSTPATSIRVGASAGFGHAALPADNVLANQALHLTAYDVAIPVALDISSGRVRFMPYGAFGFAVGRYRSESPNESGAGGIVRVGLGIADVLPRLTFSLGYTRYQSVFANGVVGAAMEWRP